MTELLYLSSLDACYQKEMEASVVRAGEGGGVLDRTIFYPTGGGQPTDKGWLKWDGGEATVTEVVKRGREVVHRVVGDLPRRGETVSGILDWERRYAHMRMHTAQHLVSALAFDIFGARTVGNQIRAERSHIDFYPAHFGEEELKRIEEEANVRIEEGRPLKIYTLPREEVDRNFSDGRVDVSRLPESVREVRIVEIEGVDVCPCGGTHVKNLKELRGIEVLSRKSKGREKVRIYYRLK
ncbi:MAG: alanyl-tRNA editing protein [Thermoplasmata archaeon]|nr:MAG: alanyl-tRNA editing protein [Thermoplasmata archaeon]